MYFILHLTLTSLGCDGTNTRIRYETPYQLKLALANYGVAHGYQLWYMKNDWREVLVYCGRNVEEGRCAGKKGNKDRVMKNKVRSGVKIGVKKKVVKKKVVKKKVVNKKPVSDSGEGTSQSPKWTKKQIRDSKQVVCPFRMYASWMSNEHSFQIKSLNSEHKCCRNYNLGSLVTFRWIALHFFKEIIEDPFMPLRKMRAEIRQKFMIDVSLGQCRRAKQLALFDHEGGLIEHYGKLYQYRQALLDSNPGSTCRLDVDESSNGSATFKRIYICFKGVKDAMGRDANNQMYPIAWAVVRVENADNWGWFLHLLHDDLSLNYGNGITIISDSHKGLIDAVNDWLPEAEHRKCTRHIYANFKKKYSGLLYQRLFWAAASCTIEQQFMQIMDQIKQLDEGAYDYLIQRNPNSWSRAFFEMDRRCAAFENGISESFNRAILEPRHKPIITMLEEIRLYIMQRLVAMNKIATNLEDTITPSIRKRLELLKEKQRLVGLPSGFQELEVRKDDQSYGVNLQHKVCQCRMWELSGVPCVHVVAAYLHCGIEIDLGVSHWYSQNCWFNAYQFSIKPVYGSNMWKRTNDVPPLPPLVRRMPGRPQKSRIKAPGEVAWLIKLLAVQELDEEAYRECMEEQVREQAKNDAEQEKLDKERREEREWEEKNDYFNPANFREDSLEEAPFNHTYAEVFIPSIHSQPTNNQTSETTNVAEGIGSAMEEELSAPAVDKGKGVESVAEQDNAPKKKRGKPPSYVDGVRIYHKNRERSERNANMKLKKAFEPPSHVDLKGTGSTPDKAFDVSEWSFT
ncbi:calcium/proton exchanger [Tanacetum coccineum]|uniref:Calcium/proton exchanger n=1 Tax=Tanacetum coccineum TaxID=301880 RepID=A0ABQ5CZC4_9ASTR